jgi:hypothetical protein
MSNTDVPVRLRGGTPREIAQRQGPTQVPKFLYIMAPGKTETQCRLMANQAVAHARKIAPKMTGQGARGLEAIWGEGWFGIKWPKYYSYMFIQEKGSRPFTMTKLAGKTIPMWINDPTGKVAKENPKAEKRTTESGKRQVKIFRKVAKVGQRRKEALRDASGRLIRWRDVPASYPGAPGRIARRDSSGKIVSHPPSGHQGVRWRNPGLHPRQFMEHSIQMTAHRHHIDDPTVYVGYRRYGRNLLGPNKGVVQQPWRTGSVDDTQAGRAD